VTYSYRPRHSRAKSRRATRTGSGSATADPRRAATTGRRRPSRRKRVALYTLLALLGAVLAYAAYTYFSVSSQLAPSREDREAVAGELDAYGSSESTDTARYVLLMGNDRRPGQGWARSDTIILMRLDDDSGVVSMLSLPRDTYAEVPGRGMTKLNHASAWGGPALLIKTVKELTGLPVHHYVQVDFEGFSAIVDALGGVEMKVERDVVSPEGVRVSAGTKRLTGIEALTVVRDRKGHADGDFGRMRTQQAFLLALAREAAKPQNLPRLPSVLGATSRNLETDMSVGQIVDLAAEYRGISSETMRSRTAPGAPRNIGGVSYVVLDEQAFRELLADMAEGGFGPDEE